MKKAILVYSTNLDAILGASCLLADKIVDLVVLMDGPDTMRKLVGFDIVYVVGFSIKSLICNEFLMVLSKVGIDQSVFVQLELDHTNRDQKGQWGRAEVLTASNWCDGLYGFMAHGKPRPKISTIFGLFTDNADKAMREFLQGVLILLLVGLPETNHVIDVIQEFEKHFDPSNLGKSNPLVYAIDVAKRALSAELQRLMVSSIWYEDDKGVPTVCMFCERQRALQLAKNISNHLRLAGYLNSFFVMIVTDRVICSALVVNARNGEPLADILMPRTDDSAMFADTQGLGAILSVPRVSIVVEKAVAEQDSNDMSKYGGLPN